MIQAFVQKCKENFHKNCLFFHSCYGWKVLSIFIFSTLKASLRLLHDLEETEQRAGLQTAGRSDLPTTARGVLYGRRRFRSHQQN